MLIKSVCTSIHEGRCIEEVETMCVLRNVGDTLLFTILSTVWGNYPTTAEAWLWDPVGGCISSPLWLFVQGDNVPVCRKFALVGDFWHQAKEPQQTAHPVVTGKILTNFSLWSLNWQMHHQLGRRSLCLLAGDPRRKTPLPLDGQLRSRFRGWYQIKGWELF